MVTDTLSHPIPAISWRSILEVPALRNERRISVAFARSVGFRSAPFLFGRHLAGRVTLVCIRDAGPASARSVLPIVAPLSGGMHARKWRDERRGRPIPMATGRSPAAGLRGRWNDRSVPSRRKN